MTPLKIAPLPGCTPGTAEKIDALNRKLGSFIHAPLNLKEVLRMEPFAADAEVVRVVAATLDNYAILPTSPEERERQRTTGLPKDYDIVGFWYCVALLALSAEPEAVRYLLVLARILMVEDPAELFLLRRIVRLLEGFPFPHLQELRSRIEGFYDTVTHQLEAFRWLEAAGIPWPESYEWEVIAQFSSDGEPYADPAAPKEERRRRVVLTLRLNSPRSLYGSCRQHNSYEISLRNEDNTTRGMWNEGHGDLFIEDRPVMQHRMFTPLQLPELFDALEGFGIRLVRKPVMVYSSQGIRNAHVKVFQMLEDQLGRNLSTIGQAAEAPDQPKEEDDPGDTSAGGSKFPEVGRAVEEALDLLKYDGDVNDSLAEMRKKWGEGISVLHEARFDEIGVQYACRSHEEGLAALGQELTCHGYRLYDLDGDDIYLLTLQPEAHATDFEKACGKAGQYCRQLKQPGRAPGTPAREIDPGRTMPCEEVPWPDDADYMLDSLAGDFCSGRWKSRDAEQWQGNFVADLRQRPLQPVKVRWNRFCCLTYSPEMDFYAAFYYIPPMQCWMLLGGKDPLEANSWKRLCDLPKQESPYLFFRPAPPMVRPLPLLRRPAERHNPHDESAGSGARPAFSPAQGAAPLQVRLRRTRTHPPCTRRRDLLFRKRLALTAGLPHIERRRVQRLHSCPRNRPTGDVRLLGPGGGCPAAGTRHRHAPLPGHPYAECGSLVGSSSVWRRLGAGQRILRFDATGFRPALESHDGRSATHPSRDVRQRKTRTYRTAERWPCGVDHTSLPCGTSRALSRGFLEFSPLGQSSANSGADANLRNTLSRYSADTTRKIITKHAHDWVKEVD